MKQINKISICVSLAMTYVSLSTIAYADENIHTDVAIVGGGLSGLSAGLTATEEGLNVVVLEKLPSLGGAGNYPEGSFGLGTKMQKESHKGTDKTPLDALKIATRNTYWRINAGTTKALLDQTGETIDWVAAHGVGFKGIKTMYPADESLWTWHIYKEHGASVIKAFYKDILKHGGKILTETPVDKLLTDASGKVIGVKAKDLVSGETINVYAKDVILATGGFANNKKMIHQYISDTKAPNMVDITLRGPGIDGRTGDGINMAIDIGAQTEGMQSVAGNAPYVNQKTQPLIRQFNGAEYQKDARAALSQPFLWVNNRGERFFNESRGSIFTEVYNAMTMNGGKMYSIFDDSMINKMIKDGPITPFNAIVVPGQPMPGLPKAIEIGTKEGWMFKADTLPELAKKIGVPAENLVASVNKVDEYADKGFDPDFGRKKEHLFKFKNKGPYYALEGIRAYFITLGGVKINSKLQPINTDGQVIKGLYVTGQDMGGLYDSTYDLELEGAASGFALTSGRMAAKNIAAELKKM